jgi:hypothetical protein
VSVDVVLSSPLFHFVDFVDNPTKRVWCTLHSVRTYGMRFCWNNNQCTCNLRHTVSTSTWNKKNYTYRGRKRGEIFARTSIRFLRLHNSTAF